MAPALLFLFSLVNDVNSLLARHEFTAAERMVRMYEAHAGATPEAAAALSWLARAALDAHDYNHAEAYATEASQMTSQLLRTRKLDADPWLPLALGASIEVHAQAMAQSGERGEAVVYLRHELAAWRNTSIAERIQKNLNLLDLEGKPAPLLTATDYIGARPPSLTALRGHPVLLFFWAHWCPDCKSEVAVLARLEKIWAPRGLVLIGPTKDYGYVAGGEPASPAVEKHYIDQVRQQYYGVLSAMKVPVDAGNFQRYGASTTPTLVLIDAHGVVRFYHPGVATEAELSAHIQALVGK